MIPRKFIGLLTSIGIVLTAAVCHAEVIDKIIVAVNTEVITQREVDKILEPIYEQYRALYYGDELIKKLEEARKRVVDQLIEDRLILSEAKRLTVEVPERDVEARISEVSKHFKTKEEFEKALQEQSVALKDLRQRYKEQLMVRRIIDQKVGSRVIISPVEMNNYYNKHINDFTRPEEVKLSNILIRPKKNMDLDKAGELARDLLKRLHEGCDFAGLAREYSEGPNASDGGSMGYVKKGDLLPAIESVVFTLKEGETSDIIQTGMGYHIFRVDERHERRMMEFTEVRRDVEEAVFREKAKDKIKDWVNNLKKNAYISYK